MAKKDSAQINTGTSTVLNSYNNSQSSNLSQQSQAERKVVVGLFDKRDSAERAVNSLRTSGFYNEEISIIAKDKRGSVTKTEHYDDEISDGALTGGTIGGLGGLLVGTGVVASIGAMAIPGVGPVIASGPIAAALGGALAGGIAGGLIDWGIPSESSHKYEQGVAKGEILTVVHTTAGKVDQVARVLREFGAKDVESHKAEK